MTAVKFHDFSRLSTQVGHPGYNPEDMLKKGTSIYPWSLNIRWMKKQPSIMAIVGKIR